LHVIDGVDDVVLTDSYISFIGLKTFQFYGGKPPLTPSYGMKDCARAYGTGAEPYKIETI
jgi:hypothetical protein